jgi:hypothetical protein
MINQSRLEVANKIAALITDAYEVHFAESNSHLVVHWLDWRGKPMQRQWMTPKGSDYPSWSRKLPVGGTTTRAIAQLVNWIRDYPVLPIQTWEYWCSDAMGMQPKEEILSILRDSDYPKELKCAFCGSFGKPYDWYDFAQGHKYSGLGCCRPECSQIKAVRNKLLDKAEAKRAKKWNVLMSQYQ